MRPLHASLAVPALVALLGPTACGTASVEGPASSSTAPHPSTTSGSAAGPMGPLGARGRLVTVTGTVAAGVERGCLVFSPDDGQPGGAWVLVGRTEGLEAGQRVTLRGARLDAGATTCQQGSPFRVEEVVG